MRGADGTAGGIAQFLAGLAMAVGGASLLTLRAAATSHTWGFFGSHLMGLTWLPLVAGAGLLFFDGKSGLGRALVLAAASVVLLGIVTNLWAFLEPTSLVDTLSMLGLFLGGLALLARSLQLRGRSSTRG